jgi:hypothetical protein
LRLFLALLLSLSAPSFAQSVSDTPARKTLWARVCESLVEPAQENVYVGADPAELVHRYRTLGGKLYWRMRLHGGEAMSTKESGELAYWRSELRGMGNELRRLPADEERALALDDYSTYEKQP